MSELKHTPVLLDETLDHLNLRAGTKAIDCTLGLGGHSEAILKKIGPKGKLMVFEQDERNLKEAKKRLKKYEKQVIYIHDNFENLKSHITHHKFKPEAILFDLGLSSPHIDDPERGFSLKENGPLDMRFDPRKPLNGGNCRQSSQRKRTRRYHLPLRRRPKITNHRPKNCRSSKKKEDQNHS